MTIFLSNIINFPIFYEQVRRAKLPIRTAYKLSRLNQELNFHINFYKENLQSIIVEYAEKDKEGNLLKTQDGQGIKIRANTNEECSRKIQELLNLKIEIPDCFFKIEDFEKVELTVEALEAGSIFIKE